MPRIRTESGQEHYIPTDEEIHGPLGREFVKSLFTMPKEELAALAGASRQARDAKKQQPDESYDDWLVRRMNEVAAGD